MTVAPCSRWTSSSNGRCSSTIRLGSNSRGCRICFRRSHPCRSVARRSSVSTPSACATAAPRCRARRRDKRKLPLEGIKIADFSAFWAGPVAVNILDVLGADVVKIESIQRPDGMRFAGGIRRPDNVWEFSPVTHSVNVGKRAITLDVASPKGHELGVPHDRVGRPRRRELRAASDGALRPRLGRSTEDQSQRHHVPHAGVRAVGAVARAHRLCHDHRASVGFGVDDRSRRRPTDGAARCV